MTNPSENDLNSRRSPRLQDKPSDTMADKDKETQDKTTRAAATKRKKKTDTEDDEYDPGKDDAHDSEDELSVDLLEGEEPDGKPPAKGSKTKNDDPVASKKAPTTPIAGETKETAISISEMIDDIAQAPTFSTKAQEEEQTELDDYKVEQAMLSLMAKPVPGHNEVVESLCFDGDNMFGIIPADKPRVYEDTTVLRLDDGTMMRTNSPKIKSQVEILTRVSMLVTWKKQNTENYRSHLPEFYRVINHELIRLAPKHPQLVYEQPNDRHLTMYHFLFKEFNNNRNTPNKWMERMLYIYAKTRLGMGAFKADGNEMVHAYLAAKTVLVALQNLKGADKNKLWPMVGVYLLHDELLARNYTTFILETGENTEEELKALESNSMHPLGAGDKEEDHREETRLNVRKELATIVAHYQRDEKDMFGKDNLIAGTPRANGKDGAGSKKRKLTNSGKKGEKDEQKCTRYGYSAKAFK